MQAAYCSYCYYDSCYSSNSSAVHAHDTARFRHPQDTDDDKPDSNWETEREQYPELHAKLQAKTNTLRIFAVANGVFLFANLVTSCVPGSLRFLCVICFGCYSVRCICKVLRS